VCSVPRDIYGLRHASRITYQMRLGLIEKTRVR
jgi:hypothetical protein